MNDLILLEPVIIKKFPPWNTATLFLKKIIINSLLIYTVTIFLIQKNFQNKIYTQNKLYDNFIYTT